MDNKKLAEILFPNINKTPDYYEELYPSRALKEGARAREYEDALNWLNDANLVNRIYLI